MPELTDRQPTRLPIEPGYFTIPDDASAPPLLLGTKCLECGEPFYPRRSICARCLSDRVEDIELGPHGTLYTYTYVRVPLFGSRRAAAEGYGVGQIDLPEGPRVQAVLSGGPSEFRIGMPMQLELETLRETEQGEEIVMYRFRPSGASPDRDSEAETPT